MGQTLLAEHARATARDAERVATVPIAATPLTYALSKRALDVAVSVCVLIAALPVFALLAVLIRLDSPGPIVFRQRRVGLGGRVFSFYKLRTMVTDARERFPQLYAYRYTRQEFVDLVLKTPDDPRLTRLGRVLRKTSVDELPNLWNVLRGDMSLVGPRPELPEMVGYYTDEELAKFFVRPGVTGLWQVSGRAILRNGQQLAADVEYVRHRSFGFDLMILVKTVRAVVLRIGAF
jgi:lipopolysaccharide/colanic/teichoic acid biosynthesis glycosyltransferase